MSSPKFMVFRLKDLKVPIFVLLVALAIFSFFMLTSDPADAASTSALSSTYEDGTYIANVALTDADLDVVVNVSDHQITSITLENFDDAERAIYNEFDQSLSFVNDYVTATQSLELPETETLSASSGLLLDAVRIALSEDMEATITTTYQVPVLENLSDTESSETSEATDTEDSSDSSTETLSDEADETSESLSETSEDLLVPQN